MSKIVFEISDKENGKINIKMTISPPPQKNKKMTNAEELGMMIHSFIQNENINNV